MASWNFLMQDNFSLDEQLIMDDNDITKTKNYCLA